MHFVLLLNDGKVDGKNVFLSVDLELKVDVGVLTAPLKLHL